MNYDILRNLSEIDILRNYVEGKLYFAKFYFWWNAKFPSKTVLSEKRSFLSNMNGEILYIQCVSVCVCGCVTECVCVCVYECVCVRVLVWVCECVDNSLMYRGVTEDEGALRKIWGRGPFLK